MRAPAIQDDSPRSLQVRDVNGDGLVDLLHLGVSRVRIWLQEQGGFGDVIEVLGTPERRAGTTATLCDINGDGGVDVVYHTPSASDPAQRFVYVELGGSLRPNLLVQAHNGLGRVTTLDYASSGALAAQDAREGRAWSMASPNPVHVLVEQLEEDGRTWQGRTSFGYRDGYFDGETREFRGFANVTVTRHGDETAEGLVREALYDVGRVEKAQKGLLLREVLSSTEGKKYQETENAVATVVLAEPAGGGRVAWGASSAPR